MSCSVTRSEMLHTLEGMLRDLLRLRSDGATFDRMSEAKGLLDGYMRALMDAGIADQRELLVLVSRIRSELRGPATTEHRPRGDAIVPAPVAA